MLGQFKKINAFRKSDSLALFRPEPIKDGPGKPASPAQPQPHRGQAQHDALSERHERHEQGHADSGQHEPGERAQSQRATDDHLGQPCPRGSSQPSLTQAEHSQADLSQSPLALTQAILDPSGDEQQGNGHLPQVGAWERSSGYASESEEFEQGAPERGTTQRGPPADSQSQFDRDLREIAWLQLGCSPRRAEATVSPAVSHGEHGEPEREERLSGQLAESQDVPAQPEGEPPPKPPDPDDEGGLPVGTRGWQRHLTTAACKLDQSEILGSLPPTQQQHLLSCTHSFSYAVLTTVGAPTRHTLSNESMGDFFLFRSGGSLVSASHPCHCVDRPAYPAQGVLITNLNAARHLANAKGSNTRRHTSVKNAVANDLTRLLGAESVIQEKAQMGTHGQGRRTALSRFPNFKHIGSSNANLIADAIVVLKSGPAPDCNIALDFIVTDLASGSQPLGHATERGAFAARAAQVKRAYYKSCYSFNSADFQPMAFDNVGCPAPMMQRFINSLFTSAKEQKLVTNVAVAKRDFCVSPSAVFARSAAASVRNYRQYCAGNGPQDCGSAGSQGTAASGS